ncbi:hypothetical protein [Hydrogenophaga sp.]|uniref:hypothetical protein n=1 Tax=Hydrogenophaga sp. TaxID=1904254 RepID=UPI0035B21044
MSTAAEATDTSTLTERSADPSESERLVLDVLIGLHAHGVMLVCGYEIADELTRQASRVVPLGWVTGRLDELHKKGAVELAEEKRRNPLTGRLCQQWFIPLKQSRLFS